MEPVHTKKRMQKGLIFACGLMAAGVIFLSGCRQIESVGAAASLSEALDSGQVQVVVTAMDGDILTVSEDLTAAQVADSGGMGGAPGAGVTPPDGAGGGEGGAPPEKPEGDDAGAQGGTSPDSATPPDGAGGSEGSAPPEKPEGDDAGAQGGNEPADNAAGNEPAAGTAGTEPAGSATSTEPATFTLTINDESIISYLYDGSETKGDKENIGTGKVLTLTVGEDGTSVSAIVVSNQEATASVENGSAATSISADTMADGEAYDSSAADENALRVDGAATAILAGATITKTGAASNSESSSFYGLNAAAYVFDGGTLALSNATITTDASGANGVFAYGPGALAVVRDSIISTSQDNSGGIMCAGGATLRASNLTVETQGESSAAIRSDRGGGCQIVSGGSYTTHGNSSPSVYCTADVTVSDAALSAENAQAVVIEGKNSTTLANCTVTGNINGSTHRTTTPANVMIYQSMSGDASVGTGTFTMEGGSFNAEHGSLFWITNTDAVVNLSGVEFSGAYDEFLTVCGNDAGWGSQGSNGANCQLNAAGQSLSGIITVDDISSLSMSLADGSSFEGAINADGQAGDVSVEMAADSSWTLTGDCYITELTGDTGGIDLNGHALYVNGEAFQG